MNRIKGFRNAAEFNELFGMETHNNGVVSRKNAILLTLYKSKSVWDWCRKNNDWNLLGIRSMSALFSAVLTRVIREHHRQHWASNADFICECRLMGRSWYSPEYATDSKNGVCVDLADDFTQSIRYVNTRRNYHVYKMKAGKFYQKLIMATEFGKMLPQQVVVFILEELVKEWKTFVMGLIPDYKLVVNNDFGRIYKSRYCNGDFESCMVDCGREEFYAERVKGAKAAYLEKDDGTIIARCIVFTEVHDVDDYDTVWRLAERQYARNGNELHKQLLVNALIKGGYIDGYKRVGAGCGDSCSFVDNEGNSLSDNDFYIECNIQHDQILSYQDSFKTYMPDEGRAYNHWKDDADDDDCLGTTDRRFWGSCREWDSYHERYVRETKTVYREGKEYTCDTEDCDEFLLFNGEYYHHNDILKCDHCGQEYLDPRNYFLSKGEVKGDKAYCCQECLEKAELVTVTV